MQPKIECTDHQLWHKNLTIACWLLIALAYYLLLFTNDELPGLFAVIASIALFAVRLRIDRKHYEWHLSQEKEDKG